MASPSNNSVQLAPWTAVSWARLTMAKLEMLHANSTFVLDFECTFNSMIESLQQILVPVSCSPAQFHALQTIFMTREAYQR
jgi:hypothetical protein